MSNIRDWLELAFGATIAVAALCWLWWLVGAAFGLAYLGFKFVAG